MPELALELSGLRKSFGDHPAVDELTLGVPAGSFFGMGGPNGAGKTTTLQVATGLLRPDAGTARSSVSTCGSDTVRAKAAVGVLPDGLGLRDVRVCREGLRCRRAARTPPACRRDRGSGGHGGRRTTARLSHPLR